MTWQKAYFQLASGLSKTIRVPVGTCDAIKKHFVQVTETLGLEVVQFKDNSPHWNRYTPPAEIPNYTASNTVFGHNRFVRELYDDLAEWSENPPKEYEELTPEFAKSIWYGFSMLDLDYDRWIEDVYVDEMEMLFEVMQGSERHGISFGEEALTAKQSAAVISLFSFYFDKDDVRLTLPNDHDYLVTSDDYHWCPSHGAWHWQDVEEANYDYDNDEINEPLRCPSEGCDETFG